MHNNQEDFSKTIRIDLPPEVLEETLSQQSDSDGPRILPSTKQADRAKSINQTSIESAELNALFENLYDAALITDLEGNIVDANPRAVQSFDYSRNELVEGNIQDIVAGMNEGVLQAICENLKNDQFTLLQAFCLRKDNTHFPSEVSSSRITIAAKDYLCFFIRDITARTEAEDEIRRAKDELEQQVIERTKLNEGLNAEIAERKRIEDQLYQAILQLQEHDKTKSEFVSNVSHELKTPVASIKYASGNILKGIAGPISDETRAYLHMIREDCQRLTRTVEDILDMSRIEADTLKLNKVKLNFPRFAERTVESLRIQVEAASLTMNVSFENVLGFVECDPEKIERVLFNIIKNAIKFNNPNGEVNVRLRYEDSGFFLLDVIDTGIGIEEKYLNKVTQRYFRIGEYVSGAGLGLAIAKEILERHGGSIELNSPPPGQEKGTIVSIRLPVTPRPNALLIYSDDNNRLLVTRFMDEFGYVVASMKLGEDISTQVADVKPDVIIVEWSSHGMEGAITISEIRNQKSLKYVPVIAIISTSINAINQEILEGLGLPVLRTPWKQEDLLDCVEHSVRGRIPTY